MPRTRYAVPEDVVRRALGGTISRAGTSDVATTLDNDELLGTQDDRETILSRLEAVESRFDRDATPMRQVSVGSSDVPRNFDARGLPWPVRIYLDHSNIVPIDSAEGDFVEVRKSRDEYRDITADEGSAWVLNNEQGIITVYRYPAAGQLPAFHNVRDRFLRISYRVSAGGDFASAGQTTISNSLTQGQTGTIDVADASRLPRSDETMLIGGSEYVDVQNVDHANDTIDVVARGKRYTTDQAWDAGTTIHFCPLDVRDAIAAMGAVEILRTEDFNEAAYDGDLDVSSKIDEWTEEFDSAVGRYGEASGFA